MNNKKRMNQSAKTTNLVSGPDGCASWYIAAACVVISCMCSAGFRSQGFLYIGIMEAYEVQRGEASWPISMIGAVNQMAAIIGGLLCRKFSPRPILLLGAFIAALGMILSCFAANVTILTLTLGCLYGVGVGLVFVMLNVIISMYFDRYKAIAFGFVYAGSTMASLIFPVILLALKGFYGFNGTLLLFGGILLNMFAFGIFLREPEWIIQAKITSKKKTIKNVDLPIFTVKENVQQSAAQKQDEYESSFNYQLSIFKCPMFWVIVVANLMFQYGFDAFMTTIVDFAIDRGATVQQAVNLLPWFSISDVLGRALFPFLADKGVMRRSTLVTCNYAVAGVLMTLLPLAKNYTHLVIIILSMGAFLGCSAVLFVCLVSDYIGLKRTPFAFGMIGIINGVFYFTKPAFFGYWRDVVKSYDNMWIVCGCMILVSATLWFVVVITERKQIRSHSFLQFGVECPEVPTENLRIPANLAVHDAIARIHKDSLRANSLSISRTSSLRSAA